MAIDSKLIRDLLKLSEKKLSGSWVLLGGTLLYYFNIEVRVTTDIDLVPISGKAGNQKMLEIFELTQELNLPLETINSAALFFLEKIKNYKKELVLIHEWKTGKIFRPNIFLFLKLKLARFFESDFIDCMEVLKLPLPELTLEMRERICTLIENEKKKKNLGPEKKKHLALLLKKAETLKISRTS